MEVDAYRGDITQAVLLSAQDLAQDAAHDLAAAGLGKIVDREDGLGGRERTDRLAHLHDQILAHLLARLIALLEGDKGIDGLTRQLVGDTDHGSFGNHVCKKKVSHYSKE